jgi:hypothetical protein
MLLMSNAPTYPKLYAILWNGTNFVSTSNVTLTDALDTTSDYQSYFGDWEEISGDFNAFYINDTGTTNILMNTWNGTAWAGQASGATGGNGDTRFVRAESFPGTDNQMVCWKEWTAGDVNCQYYNGTAFGTRFSNDTTEIGVVGRNFELAPLTNTDGGFAVMYGGNNEDWFNFMVCNSTANCMAGVFQTNMLWSTTQLGGVDTLWAKMYPDPNNPGNLTLIAMSQTAANGWYRARVYCNASACIESEPWTGFGATSVNTYDLASFTFDRHIIPIAGTSPTCGINGTYYMTPTDGNFKIGLLYTDENSNNAYNSGDNIIFCTDFNPNRQNFEGGISDYEIAFPKSFANNVDMYFEA